MSLPPNSTRPEPKPLIDSDNSDHDPKYEAALAELDALLSDDPPRPDTDADIDDDLKYLDALVAEAESEGDQSHESVADDIHARPQGVARSSSETHFGRSPARGAGRRRLFAKLNSLESSQQEEDRRSIKSSMTEEERDRIWIENVERELLWRDRIRDEVFYAEKWRQNRRAVAPSPVDPDLRELDALLEEDDMPTENP